MGVSRSRCRRGVGVHGKRGGAVHAKTHRAHVPQAPTKQRMPKHELKNWQGDQRVPRVRHAGASSTTPCTIPAAGRMPIRDATPLAMATRRKMVSGRGESRQRTALCRIARARPSSAGGTTPSNKRSTACRNSGRGAARQRREAAGRRGGAHGSTGPSASARLNWWPTIPKRENEHRYPGDAYRHQNEAAQPYRCG